MQHGEHHLRKGRVAQLLHGDVNRELDTCIQLSLHRGRRSAQDECADLGDRAGSFGEWNEVDRRDTAKPGMSPAGKCLDLEQ